MPDVHSPLSPDSEPFRMDSERFGLNEAWQSFGSETQGVPMLEAREVRRLGDRRRFTRRAGIAGATVGLAVLAGAGVILGTGGFQRTTGPDIAGSPSQAVPTVTSSPSIQTSPLSPSPSSSSSPQTSSVAPTSSATSPSSGPSTVAPPASTPPVVMGAITAANLPTNQEIYLQKPGDVVKPLVIDGISSASDEPTFWICDDGITEEEGIVAAKTAIFTKGGTGTFSRAHLIQMDSAASATRLADTIRGWNDTCPSRVTGNDGSPASAENEATTTVNGVRVDYSVQMFGLENEEGLWNGILVLVSGNRVMVVSDFARGMDYNAVGPAMHAENPDLPLVNTARELDTIIERMNA